MNREMLAVSSATRAFDRAERRIQIKLGRLLKRIEQAQAAGLIDSPSWIYQEARYQELLEVIQRATETLTSGAAGVETAKKAAIAYGADLGQRSVYLANGARTPRQRERLRQAYPQALEFPAAPIEQLLAAIGATSDGSPLADLFVQLGQDRAEGITSILLEGIGAQESPREIAKRLAGEQGIARSRAAAIARTEVHRAAREAILTRYKQASALLEGWVWMSARDARSCAACWAMHGTVHPLGESFGSHVSCRCCAAPYLRDLRTAPDQPDVRPDYGTGAESFAQMSEEDQLRVLGPGRMKLYQDGALTITPGSLVKQIDDPHWGRSRVPKPLKEMRSPSLL